LENRLKNEKKALLKRLGSWAAAALIIGYLFLRIDAETFSSAIKLADMTLYLPLFAVFILIWFLIESQNIMVVCRHLGHRLRFRQSMDIRGVTYLLMIVNPFLGLGGIAYYLKKETGAALSRTSSIMIFYSFTEMMSLLYFVTVGTFIVFNDSFFFKHLFYWSLGSILFYVALLYLMRQFPAKGLLKKVADSPLLGTFFDAKIASFFILPLWRGLYFLAFIVFFYFGLKTFSIHIPIVKLFVYVPLIFWIGCWPITPFGLGTIQASMVYFFREYSTEANILAFSITYSTLLLLFRVPIGLYYLRKYNASPTIPDSELT
jgi:uncharacterized membrane protein YbhN (UPF0104 family)